MANRIGATGVGRILRFAQGDRAGIAVPSRRALLRRLVVGLGAAAAAPVLAAWAGTAPPTAAPSGAAAPKSDAKPAPTAETKSAAQQVGAVQGTAGQAAPGATTLRFYTWTAAANLPAWKAGVEAFQQKNPKIQIQ